MTSLRPRFPSVYLPPAPEGYAGRFIHGALPAGPPPVLTDPLPCFVVDGLWLTVQKTLCI